jgi:hypothetical protein
MAKTELGVELRRRRKAELVFVAKLKEEKRLNQIEIRS